MSTRVAVAGGCIPLFRMRIGVFLISFGLITAPALMAYDEAFPKTPVDAFEIKTLPPGVLLESSAGDKGYYDADNELFGPLFGYISERDIDMTVPVEADLQPGKMRFWVAESQVDRAVEGTDRVEVIRLPERTVASLGIRGSYSRENYEEALEKVTEWVSKNPDWRAAGPATMVFWDGPFTLWFLKRSEIHVPVERVEAE